MKTTKAPRRRDAAATRASILRSARRAFARAGYDGAGVREIAAGAGVTAMLVNRYFGSKEQLFAEVAADTMASPIILSPAVLNSANPGRAIAKALVEITQAGATPLDGFRIMLYSASSARAAEIGREQIEKHHHKTMTAALSGPRAAERAAVLVSIVAGIQVMRQMIGLSALSETNASTLVDILEPLFQKLLENTGKRHSRKATTASPPSCDRQ